ncbi:MAG: acylphosphatase [Candidatus Bathyarchaeia archaeon]
MKGERMRRKMIIMGGKVHDVGYRPLLLGIAESLEVERFSAENLYVDGAEAVEVLVEDYEDKVKAFLEVAVRRRPERAVVERIYVEDYEGTVMRTESYYRYLTATQLAKIAEYGGRMIEKQDETIREVKDLRGEFKDYRQEFEDYRQEFKDYRQEFEDYRQEFRGFAGETNKNFKTLEGRYGEISAKLTQVLETLQKESLETRRELTRAVDTLSDLVRKFLGKQD